MQKKIRAGLFWFVLLQPFLDFYWFYNPPLSEIFHFSIPTIFRILAVAVLVGLYFSQKRNWQILKKQWWIIAYIGLIVVYTIVHLWHVRHFNSISPNSYGYSAGQEIFYLIRMFLPLVIIYLTEASHFSEKTVIRTIQALVGTFSGIIVITNLFTFSLGSYGGWIKENIFGWFFGPHLSFFYTASKGFFNFANTTSAILFMLVPLMAYVLVKEFNWINITLFTLQGLSMVMLGTKTASLGFGLACVIFAIAYLVHCFLVKDIKFSWKLVATVAIIGSLYAALLPKSPMLSRSNLDAKITETREKSKKPESEDKLNKKLAKGLKKNKGANRRKFLITFIKKYYPNYSLNQKFVHKSYPYQRDPEFWHKVMKWPVASRLNNRQVEQAMLDQIIHKNNSSLDKWLGISYVRMSNIFNLERDFKSQRYTLGIIGTILFLGVYVAILIYAIVYWFTKKNCRTLLISSLILANGLAIAAAYYSGNVMDFLTATIILGFFNGYMLSQVNERKKNKRIA